MSTPLSIVERPAGDAAAGTPAPEPVADLQAAELRAFEMLGAHLAVRRMIDVGAHHGSTLEPFLRAGWDVWAFEPFEASRARLLERLGASERLRLRPEAVSDHDGTATLRLALRPDGSPHDYYHSLERTRADRYHRKGGTLSVPLVSLDGLVERAELPARVGLLKVDTEGHDLAVLRGASRLECEAVVAEFWGERHPLGPSPSPAEQTVRLMAGRGYRDFLVLCHQGETTAVADSTLDGVGPAAWGNLLFFHPSRADLHRLLLRELRAPTPAAAEAPPEGRLPRLLGLAFAGRQRLRVLHVGSGGAEFVAGLRAAFPGTEPAGAGRADVVWLGPGGDAGRVPSAGADGPAVVARVTPESFAAAAALGARGYRLAGVCNALVSEEGALGGADLVLLPTALHARCEAGRGALGFEDPEALLEQARQLQQACDDRLEEVRQLRATNDERLELIQRQHDLIEALKAQRERQPARRLLKAVRRLWRGAGPREAA
jgi:FkbM family methyltransferase